MDKRRAQRVGEEIRDLLSESLLRDMRDPRLPGILTITEVRMTPDLRYATVFFTQMPEDEESVEKTLAALQGAAGYLQSVIAQNIRMRFHPEVRFRHDRSRQEFERIENLLRKVRIEREKKEGGA